MGVEFLEGRRFPLYKNRVLRISGDKSESYAIFFIDPMSGIRGSISKTRLQSVMRSNRRELV